MNIAEECSLGLNILVSKDTSLSCLERISKRLSLLLECIVYICGIAMGWLHGNNQGNN